MVGISLCAAALALVCAASAVAAPTTPLGHHGRWITDADGRVVLLHGVNMVYKRPPYHPAAGGFDDDDAAFLAEHGFNTVRVGLVYKAVEPQPGGYDDAYIEEIAATEETLARHGIFSQLDFHQDLYNERFGGEGWPNWATIDDGVPAEPLTGFPASYITSPGLNVAFTNFWLNRAGPGGVGLQNRYAAAFRHVAARFAPREHTIGYDVMNEPWPGLFWPTCATPLGCPLFDAFTLAPFHRRVISRIREVEPQKLIWYEPNVIFNFGADSHHPATGDPAAGFSFHVYCLAGAFAIPGLPPLACETLDGLVFDNADRQASQTGDALLLSEFGATDDLGVIRRNVESAEEHMVSWQYWHYCACDDPTTSGPGVQALVIDANQPPSGDNVKAEKLDVLARPYPQLVAGTPLGFDFRESSRRFELSYSTAGRGGADFAPASEAEMADPRLRTEVFVPPRHYPGGYDIDVRGAAIASAPGARVLELVACPGADRVDTALAPPGEGAGDGPDCSLPAAGGGSPPGAPSSPASPATERSRDRRSARRAIRRCRRKFPPKSAKRRICVKRAKTRARA